MQTSLRSESCHTQDDRQWQPFASHIEFELYPLPRESNRAGNSFLLKIGLPYGKYSGIVLRCNQKADSCHRCAARSRPAASRRRHGAIGDARRRFEAKLESLGHIVEDAGNISVTLPEQKNFGDAQARYLREITATCTKLAEEVLQTLEADKTPLSIGGDHSLAAGSVSGVAEFYRRESQHIGLIWIDAHSDINTPETSPSGNVHGMPLGALWGCGLDPSPSSTVGRPRCP